jgi:glycosyltransferase involved in cell wall biosynthesis
MRILVVTQYFWPENFRINELVAELVRRGNQVTVLTGLPNYPDGRVFREFRESPEGFSGYFGAEIVRVPMWPRGSGRLSLLLNYLSFLLFASIGGAWKLRRREYDVIFVFEPSPVTVGIPAIVLRRLKRAPLLFWVLDQWPETLAAVGAVKSPRVLRTVGKLVSFIYNRCDAVLAQSKSMVELVAKYTQPSKRVHYFPNWTEAMQDPREVQRAPELPARIDSFDIMFAGNIGESQDFGAILAAAELLRSETRVRWVVVGDGRMAAWVRDEIARRGLAANVLMLGRHAPERMPSFYRCADALLLSLRDEPVFALTVPGKLQSYLAVGVPVLGMLNGDGARIIEEAGAGFTCAAGDSAGLADAVRRLIALPAEKRARMAEAGRSYAKREFDRDRLISTLEQHMRALMQEHLQSDRTPRTWGAGS